MGKIKLHIIYTVFALVAMGLPSSRHDIAVAEEPHSHHQDHSTKLELNQGKKWETDEPLRKGMTEIKTILEGKLPEIHSDRLDSKGYIEAARKISASVNSIFKNCKLSPKADAALHVVLTEIIGGAETMKVAPSTTEKRQGAIRVIDALSDYAKFFEHSGWIPIAHK